MPEPPCPMAAWEPVLMPPARVTSPVALRVTEPAAPERWAKVGALPRPVGVPIEASCIVIASRPRPSSRASAQMV